MTPEAWQRVKDVFASALELPRSERASFLTTACAGDESLRVEVESLLAAEGAGGGFDALTPQTDSRLRHELGGRYRLEREVGWGGMATVYLAQDLRHDRSVALKVLHPELTAVLGAGRFEREIRLSARLHHPNILSVHDSGASAGLLWFTMPYVEGGSLRNRLAREKQLPVDEAVRIVREVAGGLHHAHQHGVVHRDVKPENILLAEGRALIADFGIARSLDSADPQLTGTGIALGTPAYMSPEQASGSRTIDARTDVYALGCVLFELLAGEPPYTGPTPQAIVARALTERPRTIHPVRPGVTPALDAVIAKAMAATPADRYASTLELDQALERAVADQGPGAPAPRFAPFARRPVFAALALGLLLGVGVLFAWRQSQGGADAAGPKVVAVLPFETRGGAQDEYLADGIADEVRGRLAAIPGVQVIARGSSTPYKNTTKSPQQIAQELRANYLLTATAVSEKTPRGGRNLHLSAELTEVTGRGAATLKWQHPFDVSFGEASLAGVFEIYAEIAGRVATGLGVALGDSTRRRLTARSTGSFASYDAYLRGVEITGGYAASDPPSLRRAVIYYSQAVALDSNFLQAWAHLSWAHSLLYFNSSPTPGDATRALRAARRAMALAPNSVEATLAMGYYDLLVAKDNLRALEEFQRGLELAPNNVDLLNAVAVPELALGRWDSALGHRQRAAALDPRFPGGRGGDLVWILLCLRRYQDAEQAADRGLALAPTNTGVIVNRVMVALAQGDFTGAQALLSSVPHEVEPATLVADLAASWDLFWVLDGPQQVLVLQLTPEAYGGDRGIWGYVLAQTLWLRGDTVQARAYADSAHSDFALQLQAAPEDAQRHVLYGISLAFLGRKDEAIREGRKAVELMPISKDALFGPFIQHELVRIYILVGEPEQALEALEPLLKMPYYLSPGWLRIDPMFDPLRDNPRFQRLVAQAVVAMK